MLTDYRRIGREFTRGVADELAKICLMIFIIGLLWLWLAPTDSSDKGPLDRSGLKIHTDAKTGRQYLSARNGGLIERKGECK